MKNIDKSISLSKQIETVQLGIYCDIIQNLLIKHRSMSIVKMIAFSFTLKKIQFLQINYYTGNNQTDLVIKFLSQVHGCYEELCSQLPYALQAIDLLIKNNICELNGSEIICKIPANWDTEDYGTFANMAIKESENYTDRQFWKEVISIV